MDTILTVSPEDFNQLDEEQRAVNFLQELLWAEAVRIGIPLGDINISLLTKVPDGGVDATARKPSNVSEVSSVILDEYNAYQVKTGTSFEPWQKSAIRKELFRLKKKPNKANLGSMIRDCLDQNGRYILVCFGHDLTSAQRKQAILHLKEFLSQDCEYQDPKVDIWSRNNLISFLKPFPSLALRVNRRLRDFQTHSSWANDANMQLSFIPGQSQVQLINALQDGLRQNNFHIRVTGEPGIGKTRLVFEATKADDLRSIVIYCNADNFLGSDLMAEIRGEDNKYQAILILDECDPDKRAIISDKLRFHSPRIKLVSIHSESDNASDVSYLEVPPLEDPNVSEIIQQYGVPQDQARKWATVCSGSPRVAHVVGSNLQKNPRDMLREPDIARVWERYIVGGDDATSSQVQQRRLVLMYLSLFKRFGFGEHVRAEAESIHKLIEQDDPTITWGKFARIIRKLKERKILQGENTLYITPKLLQIKLWVDWWDTYGATFSGKELLSLPPSSLLDWFFEMFEYAAGSEAALHTVRELLGTDGPFQQHPEILKTDRGTRFFRYLGEVEPPIAVRCLKRTIGQWSKNDLLKFREGRRDIIRLLEKTSRWRDLFIDSANLLLALAEAENETWSNNATGVFVELFSISLHPQLSPTEATPRERFPIIEQAFNSDSAACRKLALQACDRALTERTFGSVVERLQVFGREPDLWIPKTWGEVFDAYRQVWQFLMNKLDVLPLEERERVAAVLIQRISHLGRIANLTDMIASDAIKLASKPYVDDRKLLKAIIQLLHYHGDNMTSETRNLWEQVRDKLSGDDYHSAMRRYVSMNLQEDHYDLERNQLKQIQIKIQELARESFEHSDLLIRELSWLVTTDASNGYQFGYALAKEDKDFSLLPKLIEAQKTANENASLYFLGGYLRVLFEDNLEFWENLMDEFAQDAGTSIWIIELTWRTGHVTSRSAIRILQALQENNLPTWVLNQFMYGGLLNNLPEQSFIEWIEFLLNQPDPTAIYIALGLYCAFYIRQGAPSKPPAELTLRLLTNEAFAELPEGFRQGNDRVMYPYYWKLVTESFIALYPNKSLLISAFILKHFEKFDTIFSDSRSGPRSVLREIITKQPREVWTQIIPYLEESYAWQLTNWLKGDTFSFTENNEDEKAVLPLIPQEVVWEWVEENVEERAWYLATFVPPVFEKENTQFSWARELLIRYGHRDDVRRNLSSNFSTEGWTGNESEHLKRKKQKLLDYRQKETNDNVKQWIDDYIDSIERRIEHARVVEEREDF
ncbi:MAG: hypothetical protein HS126_11905 [Anaerolineales bacterium]|nr:hypothetical protein [Anaerolineales bacterium]